MTSISIIGSGWVGCNVGFGLEKLGHDIVFYDISIDKINELRDNGHAAVSDLSETVMNSRISFLSVPTPTSEVGIDLSYLESASMKLGRILREKRDYHLVVVKSTVVPGTTDNMVIPILEDSSGRRAGDGFGVCMNPEFMTEISDTWTDADEYERDFFSEYRVVIGELDKRSGDELEEIYDELETPKIRTEIKTAEMIKYACNCALATKISYWNQIFKICKELDIDSDIVAKIAGMDERIGKYGTIHGKAFGGKCLPKDLRALISFVSDKIGAEPELLKAVEDINEYMAENYGIRE